MDSYTKQQCKTLNLVQKQVTVGMGESSPWLLTPPIILLVTAAAPPIGRGDEETPAPLCVAGALKTLAPL